MKRRSIVALGLVVVLAAAVPAATTLGATKKTTANSITVWLQIDAQSGWPDVVAAANQQFQSDHPGTTVNVQYQSWTDHLQKFDATLAGGGGPDVIEMGNTEMTKYMAAGAFAPLDKSPFDNSSSWLPGPRRLGQVRRQDVRRPVLRGLARRHLPQRPVQEGRHHQAAGHDRGVRGRREEAASRRTRRRVSRRSTSRVRTGTSAMALRLRLRRRDRDAGQRPVEGSARLAEVDRRPDRVQELLLRSLAGDRRRTTGRSRTRTTSTLRVRRARWSARAGTPAASARSTRRRPRSS